MKKILFLILLPISIVSQNDPEWIIGINIGGYSANKNTSVIYRGDKGDPGTAIFGENHVKDIQVIFNNTIYRSSNFDDFFQYPYEVLDSEINSHYRMGLEIGTHIGKINNNGELFLDLNFMNLEVQEYFTVSINNPNNASPEPTYQNLPIFGEEKRSVVNLGYSKYLHNENDLIISLPIFVQLTNSRLQQNYILVNGRQYNIYHGQQGLNNTNPGGIGYGFGTGLTSTLKFNDKFSFALGYYASYSKIKMNENLQPWGLHHSFFTRIIWG